ncbi:hypothetical protein [Nodosilinea sp. P-1105]|uniref:hypothetical protein n=1 Tax=Nodosilinea sp. P-1105 TaxID=2546229 RepID=UPI00146B18A3|nr:hypothetical protein [Nodosilinea sp. P-1105]
MGSAPLIWGPPIGQRRQFQTGGQCPTPGTQHPSTHPPIYPFPHPPIHSLTPLPPQTHDATALLCPAFRACCDARAGHYPDQNQNHGQTGGRRL